MEHNKPTRKHIRLADFDYSAPASYFITICTTDRGNLFWTDACDGTLSEAGRIAEQEIIALKERFALTEIDKYVVMPDHVHLIVTLSRANPNTDVQTPNIKNIIGSFKAKVTGKLGGGNSIWQKSFYDHVIRNEKEYSQISQYIENNPRKFFTPSP